MMATADPSVDEASRGVLRRDASATHGRSAFSWTAEVAVAKGIRRVVGMTGVRRIE